MNDHIKPLGMTKTQCFCQDIYWYDIFLHPLRIRDHFNDMTKSLKVS